MSVTPMMKQYLAVKKDHPDAFLFFRLGDFYEMFFDDAVKASRILDITLTARHGGENAVPMCGVPYHAANGYIAKLTQEGHRVVICEQDEDPATAKGLVKRTVVRIISPGTNLDDDTVQATDNFIAAVAETAGSMGIAYLDLSTGTFTVTPCMTGQDMLNLLLTVQPKELIGSQAALAREPVASLTSKGLHMLTTTCDAWVFDLDYATGLLKETFSLASVQGLGLNEYPAATIAAGALVHYLRQNLYTNLQHLKLPAIQSQRSYLFMDRSTIDNLGVYPNKQRGLVGHSLFETLNRTRTPMGQRTLRSWLGQPLLDRTAIEIRHDSVEEFISAGSITRDLQQELSFIRDIEKIVSRLTCGIENPRDLVALRESLEHVPAIAALLARVDKPRATASAAALTPLPALADVLQRGIGDNPPPVIKNGGFIRKGFSRELDELQSIAIEARTWIAELQASEIERTGIKSLKIKFNSVFGFYIEVTKANLSMVPADYERKQTLVNAERFMIPKLKEYEEKVLGADERSIRIEAALFGEIRQQVIAETRRLQELSSRIAAIDVLISFAIDARDHRYCRPSMTDGYDMTITGGRHPVVERTLASNAFIENDVTFISGAQELLLITGPNMSGKSTYLRQNALIALMAQAGSFVPADAAMIGIVDRIFTRIGASDNVTMGESTFMVEMIETANIIHNATRKSLVIMDEVGRGTSTFDGVSIAWAICEHFVESGLSCPKVLFATHYHELSVLEQHHANVKNFNAAVKDDAAGIVFLRKMRPGAASKSYGIHVAELAGIPKTITRRAQEILTCIEQEKLDSESLAEKLHDTKKTAPVAETESIYALPLFKQTLQDHPALVRLRQISINTMTPLEALTLLNELKDLLDKESLTT